MSLLFGLSNPCYTWQDAVPPRVKVPPIEDRHFGIVLVEHAAVLEVSVPHLAVPLTHTFTVDGNVIPNADVPLPHRHWHMPKLDTGEYPLALSQVTPLHGSANKAIQLKILMHFYFNCCFNTNYARLRDQNIINVTYRPLLSLQWLWWWLDLET